MATTKRIVTIDVETNGLFGDQLAFYMGYFEVTFTPGEDPAVVLLSQHEGRVGDEYATEGWVQDNVLPAVAVMPVTASSPEELVEAVWSVWIANKDLGCTPLVHMGHPVETGMFRRAVTQRPGRDWDGPYPGFRDVWQMLDDEGLNGDSVNQAIETLGLDLDVEGLSDHHPKCDAIRALRVYVEIMRRRLGSLAA